MGLTDSSELMDEHWVDKFHNEEMEEDIEEEQEDDGDLEEKDDDDDDTNLQLPDELISSTTTTTTTRNNRLLQQPIARKKLNEDEINEEKMWIDAISAEPKSSHLRNQLANHYFSQNRLHEAEFAYKAAINLDVANSIAHYDYAFMRHHQFYWSLAKNDSRNYYTYATESKLHYSRVLLLSENDIETHYQLSLLYLTMLETTLIESIDNISSPLNYNHEKLLNNGRGIYSKWYSEKSEIYKLCHRHLEITMNLCQEIDPVLFGTYITFARLLYIECTPNPFIYFKLTSENIISKLNIGIKYLNYALEINESDATLHHDLALLLSHELIGKYEKSIYHWLIAHKLDSNSIYSQQIGYIYQYKLHNYKRAIKYYNISVKINDLQSQIWNNLGILSASNAKKQSDIIYATKCWRKCLTIDSNHCEAHRNLGNIQWLHYYDQNKGEIHLQRAIAIVQQTLQHINQQNNNKYYATLKEKFRIFLAQCKSDYGGLLLMMFKYNIEAERELLSAINYDSECISAHYYLGKYLYEYKKDYPQSIVHLNKYISMELHNKNLCNKAHSHQILGEIYMNCDYKNQNYQKSQFHFSEAIKLSQSQSQTSHGKNQLPKWTKCKIHCGFADSIIKYLIQLCQQDSNIINKIRNKYPTDEQEQNDVKQILQSIEIAKKHYRLILKLNNKYVNAPLGLAIIFGKIEGKIKLADRYYNDSIKICKEKLIKLYKKYIQKLKKKDDEQKESEQEEENNFKQEFKLNMIEINNILFNQNDQYDEQIINIIKEIKQYCKYCIEAHLGKVDLIIISCHKNKFKEALSHCQKILYLDIKNINALTKKSLLYYKLNQKQKAQQCAKYALQLAKQYDQKYKNNNNHEKEKIVKNNLNIVFKQHVGGVDQINDD